MGETSFHGWRVVSAAFVGTFFVFGIVYAFTAFFPSLEAAFAAPRADVALISGLSVALLFTTGVVSGPLADRIGPRRVAGLGMAMMAAGLALTSRAGALWQVYLAYGLGVGVGAGMIYVPAISAVQRWFLRRRGLASGIAVAGIGIGTLVVPPLAALLIAAWGWRATYAVLAGAVATLGLSAMLLLDHSPERRGQHPDGVPPADGADPAAGAIATGLGIRAALRMRVFWMLSASTLLMTFAMYVPFVHLVPYVAGLGLSATTGAWLLGLIGIASVLGRFLFGGVSDRFGRLNTLTAVLLGMAAMLALWWWARDLWSLIAFAAIFGTLYGGFAPLMPPLIAEHFGLRHLGALIGIIYSSAAPGALAGPTLAGLLYDVSGSYRLAIFAAAAAMLLAALCLLCLRGSARLGAYRAA